MFWIAPFDKWCLILLGIKSGIVRMLYNCGDFSSCAEISSYFNTCPGDPSNLDGNNDGRACESRCG